MHCVCGVNALRKGFKQRGKMFPSNAKEKCSWERARRVYIQWEGVKKKKNQTNKKCVNGGKRTLLLRALAHPSGACGWLRCSSQSSLGPAYIPYHRAAQSALCSPGSCPIQRGWPAAKYSHKSHVHSSLEHKYVDKVTTASHTITPNWYDKEVLHIRMDKGRLCSVWFKKCKKCGPQILNPLPVLVLSTFVTPVDFLQTYSTSILLSLYKAHKTLLHSNSNLYRIFKTSVHSVIISHKTMTSGKHCQPINNSWMVRLELAIFDG